MFKFLSTAFFSLIFLASQPLCAQIESKGNPDDAKLLMANVWVEKIQEKGELKIGFDTFSPWAMPTKDGNYIGFEIDVAEALAADLGVKAKFVPTGWDGILPALLGGKFDILIGGMGITPERSAKVSFTDPYEYSGVAIAASKKTAPGLSAIEDFNKKDFHIAVKLGTTAAKAAKEIFPNATIVEFSDEGQTAQELKNGKAQALLAGAPYPAELALDNPDEIYIPISGTLTKEPIGMALAPKNKDALPAINAWIKARHDSGWLDQTWKYWFESRDWQEKIK